MIKCQVAAGSEPVPFTVCDGHVPGSLSVALSVNWIFASSAVPYMPHGTASCITQTSKRGLTLIGLATTAVTTGSGVTADEIPLVWGPHISLPHAVLGVLVTHDADDEARPGCGAPVLPRLSGRQETSQSDLSERRRTGFISFTITIGEPLRGTLRRPWPTYPSTNPIRR